MYRNIICFFSFPFTTELYQMVLWGRESKTFEMYTQREIEIFGEPLRSALARLVHGHLKTMNHLLYFCKTGIGPFQGIESSKFLHDSLLSRVSFSSDFFLSLKPGKLGRRPATTADTSSSSFSCRLRCPCVKIFLCLYNFQDAHAKVVTPTFRLRVACGHASWLACHPCNPCDTSTSEILAFYLF